MNNKERSILVAEMTSLQRCITVLQGGVPDQVPVCLENFMHAAAVAGYRVAGKTGTTIKVTNGNYEESRYTSIFAGIAPVSDPRLAVVVMIDEPNNGAYYAGVVAAPVFSKIVADATRILAIPPDAINAPANGEVTVALR